MNLSKPPLFFTCILLCLAAIKSVCAQQADEFDLLKTQVQLRATGIEELKKRGVLKEISGGMLSEASSDITPPQRRLMEEENSTRLRLFELIAARTQKTPSEVANSFHSLALQSHSATVPFIQVTPNDTNTPPPPPPPPPSKPLKVLTRPLSALYSEPLPTALKIKENMPAFSVYYVYQKQAGWYEIGTDNKGKKLGWMKADDVMEWKQNLVVAYSHPEGRKPVLMFHEKQPLKTLVEQPRASRSTGASQLYESIERGRIPSNFPVKTMEPYHAVDKKAQFYVLPILSYEVTEMDGREGRILQLAAASRERGATPPGFHPTPQPNGQSSDLQVDVVFVMDLTLSMGPFASATLQMIRNIVAKLGSDTQIVQSMRFGFWGYRDFPEKCPGIEFNTRNFTPELLPLAEFAGSLGDVRETKVDSVDYEEDVLAGVTDAIQKTHWRAGALRQIILVGDAPGRSPGMLGRPGRGFPGYPNGPKGTKSGLDVEGVRALANSRKVYITGLYLKEDKWKDYAEEGKRQFQILAHNPNNRVGEENMRELVAEDPSVYADTAESLSNGIIENLRRARSGQNPEPNRDDKPSTSPIITKGGGAKNAGLELANNMFRGAYVEYLGSKDSTPVPRDVTVWASDKDLMDPIVQSLEVQVYLTKNELNNLKLVADSIVNAGLRQKISGEDFFQALQAVVTSAAADPEQIRKAETLAKTGLIPEFIHDLPYQSSLMQMTKETWARMSPDAQDQFINTVLAKLQYYQLVHDNSDLWVALNEGDDRDNWVAGIPLDQLP